MRRLIAVVALLSLTACTPEWNLWRDGLAQGAADAGLPCPEHAAVIDLAGLPDHFHTVARRESTCDPAAVNGSSGATGLFQVMPMWADDCGTDRHGLLNAWINAVCAAHIYQVQGPGAWSATW
jgi:hypothetical protein